MKTIFYLLILAMAIPCVNAQKISEMQEITDPSANSWIEVSDLDASPKTRK